MRCRQNATPNPLYRRDMAGFRGRLCLHSELVDGVDRQNDTGDPQHAALIPSRNVVPQIVVVDAVDLPVDLIGSCTVQRTESAEPIERIEKVL